ncbi:MAG: bifunctional 4-hydroxy-2-oxoglutarate aldolase/2-dehydro-3-deoxy-phosphogluconate aldolase [Alphaproteobacteria bacterium]
MRILEHQINVDNILAGVPVIPVLTIERVEDAAPLATALVEGGLPVVEVTLRTDQALAAISVIAAQVPGAVVGAGTVLTPANLVDAVMAGAKFAVSPGTTPALAEAAISATVPFIPAGATASEMMVLAELGFETIKFFPAEQSGGTAMLRGVGGPLAHLTFVPTGGIGAGNARAYLDLGNVSAVGGSWVAPNILIDVGDWAGITALAREAVAQLK